MLVEEVVLAGLLAMAGLQPACADESPLSQEYNISATHLQLTARVLNSVVDPDPNSTRIQELCGSTKVKIG